ncbi:S-layer protein [Deinococcus phoenicis]|uniref:S-layer protein n=1 Tax=Deinococcus phoenicis TaxID=1476583 RepID=A0A016QKQ5_9DEIO|nr:S-layer homology domain-containing protein [Deinococcus phoenicis]EYB66745.1 S-layer protein [Deinococcus phoenicis]
MKKSLFILTAALSFGVAAAQTAAPATAAPATAAPASAPQVPALTDVPAGHWAKDAIDRLVSKGIILGYPDGTFRGTQNLTRYEAAVIIARLLDQMRTGDVAPGALTQEDLTALQNAIQELAADLTALGVRVSDLEENAVNRDDFTRLEARVEELAAASGDAAAIADLKAQIDELTARADDYDALRADIDDNASSIAALNDLTVLLNQDILNLQDRVSAVESAQADFVQRADFDALTGRVTGIDTRVTTLEKAPKFSLTGTIDARYGRLALIAGTTNFDVDRLTRQTFADGVFSTGVNCPTGVYAASGNAVSCTDTNGGAYVQDSSIVFGVKATNLTTANGQVTVNNAAVNFSTNNSFSLGNDVFVKVDNASADGTIAGQKFDVRYESYNSKFKFNDYLFANDNDTENAVYRRGVVANITATSLPLQPQITVVAGTAATNTGKLDSNTGGPQANILVGNYYGVRASVNPYGLGTVGLSFAQNDGNRTAFGVDYDLGFGSKNADGMSPFTLTGAYVASIPQTPGSFVTGGGTFQNAFSSRDQAFFTEGKADLGIVKFGANFRAIDPAYNNGVAGMSANDSGYYYGAQGYKSSMPYLPDQVGYGAGISTNLGPVALAAYGDSYVPYLNGDRNTSFGVSAGAKLAGFKLVGFYNRSTLNNDLIHADLNFAGPGASGFSYNLTSPYMDIADVPFAWSSTYGAVLNHDGAASNALVKGLNFTVADAYFYGDRVNDFQVYGNYSGTFAGVKIEPFARYHLLTAPNDVLVDNGGTPNDASDDTVVTQTYNTVKYGVKLSTQPLTAVPLQPSVFVNFANRISNVGRSVQVQNGTTTELFGQAGISLNQFLVPNMKASIGYAYYQGFNLGSITASSASGASATYGAAADRFYRSPLGGASDPYTGASFGTQSGKLQGVFAQLSWNGLSANYGIFRNTDLDTPSASSVAQGFKVSYVFKF